MSITVEMRTEVAQLYTALFGRAPDIEGLGFWTTTRAAGKSVTEVADAMYGTIPARAYYPLHLTNSEIVASFYLNVLGRTGDAGGLAFWTAQLDATGATPGSVLGRMISVVANYTGTDPAGLLSQQYFNNRVTVAQHYAESGGGIAGATDILVGVTANPATVVAAIAFINTGGADVVAPAFATATVNGASLVMAYVDAHALDATHVPAASAFIVLVDGVARAVSTVAVSASANTVTLTLASAVTSGQAVTVVYTDPTSGNDANAIQDASGNDAATLGAKAATNNTPVSVDITAPVFTSATVTGTSLVLTYTEINLLDATHIAAAGAFTVMVAGVARAVSTVAVDANAKVVTLTLASTVASGEAVTVAYTDPTTANDANAIQDASGNDAATLSATAVTNTTTGGVDTTKPVFASATVDRDNLEMTYTELNFLDFTSPPPTTAFTVMVAGVARAVSAVSIQAVAKTVTLTLASAVVSGQTVTVGYTDPTSGNDVNAIQDLAGNDAVTITARPVTNMTPDVTAPLFASASVNGASLVMTYTELNLLDAANVPAVGAFTVMVAGVARTVDSVAVDANAKTVTLTLASAVTNGQAVTVAYADPTAGNNANAIQDATGNDAASLSATVATNSTPLVDTTAPVFASAAVNGATLVMTYTETNLLNATSIPATGAFAVSVGGSARAVSSVVVDANLKTVTLTLASAVTNGQSVTVAYTDPTAGNDANAIQDGNGNDAASLGATAVTNTTPDTTAPLYVSASVNGLSLVMSYNELTTLDAVNGPIAGDFMVMVGGSADAVSSVLVDALAKTVTLTLAVAVTNGQVVDVSYTDPTSGNDTNAIQDAAGNDAVSLVGVVVANATP